MRNKPKVMSAVAALSVSTLAGSANAYSPQPYAPVTNSPAQLIEKQTALDALRAAWSGEDYSANAISSILSNNGVSDPASATSHFNPDGSWHQSLPTGATFSSSEYNLNRAYFFDLLALAFLEAFQGLDQRQTIYDSLSWYFANGHAAPPQYHETFNYQNPEETIGGTMVRVGLLMFDEFHADRVSDPAVEAVFQEMREYGRQFIHAAPQIRGPNWSFRIENCLRYILFTDQVYDMDEYAYHWKKALSFNRWETETDGVHPDWSMMHHGDMNYWGMYGISWTSRVIEFGELFANTPWAYQAEQLDFIANCMIEGTRWVLLHGVCEYTSAPKRGTMLLKRTDSVAESFKELYGRLITLGGDLLTRKSELINLEAVAFLPPWTAAGAVQADQPEFAGHRYFWTTEYQVHRRSNFGIYVRRCSQRTRPPEDSSISTSQMHLNYGTGYTAIVRRGDELRFSRLCWNFQHVPGTTVEQGKTKEKVPHYKVLALVLVVMGMLVASTQWGSEEDEYDESEDITVGRVIGEQMAAELEPGGVVLVLDVAFEPGKNPRVDARYAGLIQGWGDAGFQPVRIDPKHLIDSSGDERMASEAVYALYEGYMEARPYMNVLSTHPEAEAVVSFVGLPYNSTEKVLALSPKLYLGRRSMIQVPSEKLIRMKNVQMIVELRPSTSPAPDDTDRQMLPKAFTQRYRMLRAAG